MPMFGNLLYYSYYLVAYILISYYGALIVMAHEGDNTLTVIPDEDNYFKLTFITIAFLFSDLFVKYKLHPKTFIYYALQLHHVIGIVGFSMAYYFKLAHLIVANLSLFELSSIPLLFYSDRIWVHVSLPATWIVYLIVRILWGNYILMDSLRQLVFEGNILGPKTLTLIVLMHGFFLVANNYWFYLLTRQVIIKIIKPFWYGVAQLDRKCYCCKQSESEGDDCGSKHICTKMLDGKECFNKEGREGLMGQVCDRISDLIKERDEALDLVKDLERLLDAKYD